MNDTVLKEEIFEEKKIDESKILAAVVGVRANNHGGPLFYP